MDAAIADGSVVEWTDGDTTYCGFRKTNVGVEKAALSKQSVQGGQVELGQSQFNTISKRFSTMAWDVQQSSSAAFATGSAGSGDQGKEGTKALEHASLTEKMAAKISDASAAIQKLHGFAMKLVVKCANHEDRLNFEEVIMEVKRGMNKDDHILTWKELLEGVVLLVGAGNW